MKILKCNDNHIGSFNCLAKRANRNDQNWGIKILASYFDSEFGYSETFLQKVAYIIKMGVLPLAFVSGLSIYGLDILFKKTMLSISLGVSIHKIASDESSFFNRDGVPKIGLVASINTISCKNLLNANTETFQYVLKDIHAESCNADDFSKFKSLKIIGGNLYLSDNVEFSNVNSLLPNLKHIGGKVFVNGQENFNQKGMVVKTL